MSLAQTSWIIVLVIDFVYLIYLLYIGKRDHKHFKHIHKTNRAIYICLTLASVFKIMYYSRGAFTGIHRCQPEALYCIAGMEALKHLFIGFLLHASCLTIYKWLQAIHSVKAHSILRDTEELHVVRMRSNCVFFVGFFMFFGSFSILLTYTVIRILTSEPKDIANRNYPGEFEFGLLYMILFFVLSVLYLIVGNVLRRRVRIDFEIFNEQVKS